MVANYILSYLKNILSGRENGINLPLIIIIVLGIISSVICESLLAYFAFLTFKDFYEYSSALATISTAGIFCFQAVLLFYYSYYLLRKTTRASFLGEEYSDLKKITHAFAQGFPKKPL